MSAVRIQNYIRVNAARGRETERIGPFLATFSPHTTNPFLNYAIPDAAARPMDADARALADAFRSRGRTPRLEYLPGVAPAVESVLVRNGFRTEDRLPLMACPPEALIDRPGPPGIELVQPRTDDELRALLTVQHEAYDDPDPVTPERIASLRTNMRAGGMAVLARDQHTGAAAGAGNCDVIHDGIAELAAFAVSAPYRRRGIGAAITAHLTRAAHEAGAVTVFLTPDGPPEERIYARTGFRRIDEVLFLSATG